MKKIKKYLCNVCKQFTRKKHEIFNNNWYEFKAYLTEGEANQLRDYIFKKYKVVLRKEIERK